MSDGDRLKLTELTASDSEEMFRWINNRDQVLYSSPYKPVHEAQHHAWFESIQGRSDVVIFAIRLHEDEALIGSAQILNISPIHRSAELQLRLGNVSARGGGLGTQALRKVIRFGFMDLNLHRLYSHVFATNIAARRMNEKAGMKCEGTLREAAWIGGQYVDVLSMGLLRSEWADREEDS